MTEITCPSCKTTNASWQVYEMTGEGKISFEKEEEPVVEGFTPSHVSVSCPTCGHTVEGNIYELRDKLLTN